MSSRQQHSTRESQTCSLELNDAHISDHSEFRSWIQMLRWCFLLWLSICADNLLAATAMHSDCKGASALLDPKECAAWQDIYHEMGGFGWIGCTDHSYRHDPCSCTIGSSRGVRCEQQHITGIRQRRHAHNHPGHLTRS